MDNLALARSAFSTLEARRSAARAAEDYRPYFDLLADDVVLTHGLPAGTPLAAELHGKPAVVDHFTVKVPELLADLRLDGTLEYVGTGDCIVVLGREAYTIRHNGLAVRGKAFAIALDFASGRIVRDLQIKEMTEFVDACRMAA